MNERIIVIEQRLRTTGLVLVITLVLVVFVGVSITLVGSNNGGTLVTAVIVEAVALVALLFAFLMFLRIVVRVVETPEGRALEIVYGPGGLVRQVFGPDQLVAAFARNISFMQLGGWGYRGNLKVLRRAALVTRRGHALEVQLQRRRRFIVTVDDPADFVMALALPTP